MGWYDLGVSVDLVRWYRTAERDPHLRTLAHRFRGLKPPRFPTLFEALVNAIACQQLSLIVGLELLNRLAVACDVKRGTSDGEQLYAFPAPRDLARLSPGAYRAIGFSLQKARALRTLALGVERREVDLDRLTSVDDVEASAELRQLRGVGRWTAEYVLLRGLGRLHVFPRGRCRCAERPGSLARSFIPTGLRRRTKGDAGMASVCRTRVLPPAARGFVSIGRSGTCGLTMTADVRVGRVTRSRHVRNTE